MPQAATIQAPAHPAAVSQAVPLTDVELQALMRQSGELSNQLQALTARRSELVEQRRHMGTEEGRDHEARIRAIDQRSGQIEQQLFQSNEAIASALATGVPTGRTQVRAGEATTTMPVRDAINAVRSEAEEAVYGAAAAMTASVVAAVLVWRGFRRFIWKRKPVSAPAVPDHSVRLEQLQHSVDTIAIEVERISEAQRFVAKILNEKVLSLGAGDAQSLSLKGREAVPLRHEERR